MKKVDRSKCENCAPTKTLGQKTWFLTDALGSVVGTFAQEESAPNYINDLNTYRYKPYGGLLAKTGASPDPRYLWTGNSGSRYSDRRFAEQYNWHRHYGHFQGQWTSRDILWPEELAYGYVSGSPISSIDPIGLFRVSLGKCNGVDKIQIITPGKGDWTGVVSGIQGNHKNDLISGEEAIEIAQSKFGLAGKDCIAVNGTFYGDTFPVGDDLAQPTDPIVDCEGNVVWRGKPVDTFKPPEKPPHGTVPVIVGHGHLHGRVLPPKDNLGERNMNRTGACVTKEGRLLFLMVVTSPVDWPTWRQCANFLCKAPNRIAYLDAGGSTQIYRKPPGKLEGGPRRVHNWIVICD